MDRNELYQYIQNEQPNICQISVLQNGNEVYGAEWNGYQRTDCAHIMSATKSVMSLLVGIAVDRGWIGSVEDKVLSYFPEYPVKRGEKTIRDVTIKHLLTMRAPYKGHGDPWTKVCSSADWTAASLDFLGGRKGITGEFDYRTVCLHILSGLLYKAAGMKTVDFANQYLFRPLGIREHENYYAETAEEHKRFTIEKRLVLRSPRAWHARLRLVHERRRYGKDWAALPPEGRLGWGTDRVLKMDRGNALPEGGDRRRLPGDVLWLSLVDRASGEKYLCRHREQRQRDLCGPEQEDRRRSLFLFQAKGI